MGVEESKIGTTPGVTGLKSPDTKGGIPGDVSNVSPAVPKTYTQEEVDNLTRHAASSERGRVQVEIDVLKRDLQSKDDEISDINSEITKLEDKIEGLANDDPTKFEAVKELKAAREERNQLKSDRRSLGNERQQLADEFRPDREARFEGSVFQIAGEYEGGDHVKLKALCTKFEKTAEADIRDLAETLWAKKGITQAVSPPSVTPFPGITVGGSDNLEGLSRKDLYQKAYSKT